MLAASHAIAIDYSVSAQTTGVTSVSTSSAWLRGAQQKLKELSEMEAGWDGYRSRPIQLEAVKAAAALLTDASKFGLSEPQIFPVPGGGLQFEWDNAGREMELGILPNGDIEFLITDSRNEMLERRLSPSWSGEIYRLANWFNNQQASVNDFC